jgi:NAD-dependent dihydropyrimidine dehydrogenase PreA subunit
VSGLFIDVSVDDAVAADPALAAKLAEVCPVDIFAVADDGRLRIKDENLDECVLCRLCLNLAEQAGAGGGVRVVKLYETDPGQAVLR